MKWWKEIYKDIILVFCKKGGILLENMLEKDKKTILVVTHANPLKLISKRMENLSYKKMAELRFSTSALKIYDLRLDKENGYEVLTEYNINKDMEG